MIRSTEEETMKKATAITCVFLDIGGVLLTNGWDHHARKRAGTNFKLEWTEMEDRHEPTGSAVRKGAVGRNVVNWEQTLKQKWVTLRISASPAGRLYRRYPDVPSHRGRFGDSKHSSHGLTIGSYETSSTMCAHHQWRLVKHQVRDLPSEGKHILEGVINRVGRNRLEGVAACQESNTAVFEPEHAVSQTPAANISKKGKNRA